MSEEDKNKSKPITPKEIEEKRKTHMGGLSDIGPLPADIEKLVNPGTENFPPEVNDSLGNE